MHTHTIQYARVSPRLRRGIDARSGEADAEAGADVGAGTEMIARLRSAEQNIPRARLLAPALLPTIPLRVIDHAQILRHQLDAYERMASDSLMDIASRDDLDALLVENAARAVQRWLHHIQDLKAMFRNDPEGVPADLEHKAVQTLLEARDRLAEACQADLDSRFHGVRELGTGRAREGHRNYYATTRANICARVLQDEDY